MLPLVFTGIAKAGTGNNFGNWTTIRLTASLTDKILIEETVSPRWSDSFETFNTVLLRSTLSYKLKDGVLATFGYDWFKYYDSSNEHENRLWQQFLFEHQVKKLIVDNRFRLEERLLPAEGEVTRLRYQLMFSYPLIKSEKLFIEWGNEIFMNLNSTDQRTAGLDQNRVYVGFRKIVSEHVNVSMGYQLQHLLDNADRINHLILLNLNYTL